MIFISAASSNTVQLQATAVARLAKDLQNKVNIKFKVSWAARGVWYWFYILAVEVYFLYHWYIRRLQIDANAPNFLSPTTTTENSQGTAPATMKAEQESSSWKIGEISKVIKKSINTILQAFHTIFKLEPIISIVFFCKFTSDLMTFCTFQ